MRNPEAAWINKIDREHHPSPEYDKELGRKAEDIVIDYLQMKFGWEVRHATPEEDEGHRDIGTKKIIDLVAYLDRKPILASQVTTATDSVARTKKLKELQDYPFLRLSEMKPQDPAIPRTITFLEGKEVNSFLKDRNFASHPRLELQILESNISSLKFNLLKTRDPSEIERLNHLLKTLEQAKEKGKTDQTTIGFAR